MERSIRTQRFPILDQDIPSASISSALCIDRYPDDLIILKRDDFQSPLLPKVLRGSVSSKVITSEGEGSSLQDSEYCAGKVRQGGGACNHIRVILYRDEDGSTVSTNRKPVIRRRCGYAHTNGISDEQITGWLVWTCGWPHQRG